MRTLYHHGRIHTPAPGEATAMLVDGAVVTWIGDDDQAHDQAGIESVDLDGAFVTPAFVDAHAHVTSAGLALTSLDLSGAQSLAETLAALERAARVGRGRPILGSGWDETRWPERRAPTGAELDRAAYGGAVYLSRVDAHSAVVSSALLAAVPEVRHQPGFQRDGLLRGLAHDTARTAAFAGLGPGAIRAAQRAALAHAAGLGIGCLHEMAGPSISSAEDLAGLLELAAQEPGPQVLGYWGELLGIQAARELGAVGAGGDLFCDGSLGSHTAALGTPYADRPDTAGELRFETAELAEHIRQCTAAGLQAGFHAIGDAAVDQVLDAVDIVTAGSPVRSGQTATGGAGHRLEHAEMVRDPARLAASGLVASMQPAFDAAWGGPEGLYALRLGAARAGGLNRFAELASAGVPLAFGSDAPVTPFGPWAAVRAAVYPHEPGAALSPGAAFAAHTRGGWRAAGQSSGGQLVVGAAASFAVWEAGELAVDDTAQRRARSAADRRSGGSGLPDLAPGVGLPTCQRTVVEGVTVFTAD